MLRDFRCHQRACLAFEGGATVFCGPNGAGKSALLEAIHFASRLRSFRSATPRDMVRRGADSFEIGLATSRERLGVFWTHGGRRLSLNGGDVPSAADYWGTLPCVALTPGDVRLVNGPAASARRFLSALASQLDRGTLRALLRYSRLARQRQALLSAGRADRGLWELLTEQMRETGEPLQRQRRALVRRLAVHAARAYREISGGAEALRIAYRPGPWETTIESERRAGRTLVGLQRDVLDVTIGGTSPRHHASEGQLRSAAIAVRAAEIAILQSAAAGRPVVLVDDVFGELDPSRRAALARLIPPDTQLFATVADGRWVPETLANARTVPLPL